MSRSGHSITAELTGQPGKQRGAAAVEFALLAGLLFTLLFGIIETSRVLFYWNAATEATRLGARLAVVCAPDAAPVIRDKMQAMLGILQSGDVDVIYSRSFGASSDGCGQDDCRSVTVRITGVSVSTLIPLVPLTLNMPSFTTTLPRESLDSANNPDCEDPAFRDEP